MIAAELPHPESLVARLRQRGAVSFPFLEELARAPLLAEARACRFEPEPEVVGRGERVVRQQMESCNPVPADGELARTCRVLQELLARTFGQLQPYPFDEPLRLDRWSLQRYPHGSLGITPHRDGRRFINLVALIVLAGEGRFYVCADRAGSGRRDLESGPGRVLLMRAPGFLCSRRRPLHGVSHLRGERCVLGVRQERGSGAESAVESP